MEAGDIPGAVRFFESAVQREPDNQLVRLSSLWFHLRVLNSLIILLIVTVSQGKCKDAVSVHFFELQAWQYLGTCQAENEQEFAAISALRR